MSTIDFPPAMNPPPTEADHALLHSVREHLNNHPDKDINDIDPKHTVFYPYGITFNAIETLDDHHAMYVHRMSPNQYNRLVNDIVKDNRASVLRSLPKYITDNKLPHLVSEDVLNHFNNQTSVMSNPYLYSGIRHYFTPESIERISKKVFADKIPLHEIPELKGIHKDLKHHKFLNALADQTRFHSKLNEPFDETFYRISRQGENIFSPHFADHMEEDYTFPSIRKFLKDHEIPLIEYMQ